jgi:hypothetical protein
VKFFINFYVCLVLGFEPDFFETFGGLKKMKAESNRKEKALLAFQSFRFCLSIRERERERDSE